LFKATFEKRTRSIFRRWCGWPRLEIKTKTISLSSSHRKVSLMVTRKWHRCPWSQMFIIHKLNSLDYLLRIRHDKILLQFLIQEVDATLKNVRPQPKTCTCLRLTKSWKNIYPLAMNSKMPMGSRHLHEHFVLISNIQEPRLGTLTKSSH
jgi:hypothetical protein